MARRHPAPSTGTEIPTSQRTGGPAEKADRSNGNTELTAPGTTRRGVLRMAGGATIAAGLGGVLSVGRAAAAPQSIEAAIGGEREVQLDPGSYVWQGGDLDIAAGEAVVGGGGPGDVVWNLEAGTMDGEVRGRLENVVVRGANPEPKAGIDIYRGGVVDGFVWPEGGRQLEDRAFYTPGDDGEGHGVIRNAAWGMMGNNGAYCDDIPMVFENCAALNNNVSGFRVGHDSLSDPLSATTTLRNCLVAVTVDVPYDDETGTSNARGVRIRKNGHIVIEGCYFDYRDVEGASAPIDVEDDVPDAVVEVRNCTFYNETSNPLVLDETGGEADITIEDCVAAGPGSHEVPVDGDAVTSVDSVDIPKPSALTGYAAADLIPGADAI